MKELEIPQDSKNLNTCIQKLGVDNTKDKMAPGAALTTADALSLCLGAAVGLLYFCDNIDGIFSGIGVLNLLLISMTIPKAMDMEWQCAFFYWQKKRVRVSKAANILLNTMVWPMYWATMVMLISSTQWATVTAVVYALYYVVVDSSPSGVLAALLVSSSYASASYAVDYLDTTQYVSQWSGFLLAFQAMVVILELACMLVPPLQRWGGSLLVAQVMLMSPLLVTIDISLLLGFKTDFKDRVQDKVRALEGVVVAHS